MTSYNEISGLNWSSLKAMATSPLMYRWRQDHPRPDSAALALGRAVHCAVLEPLRFAESYIVRPAGLDGRTKEGRAWMADARDRGVEVLSAEDGATVTRCSSAVHGHETAHALLTSVRTEVATTWALDGVACKGRLDAISEDRGGIVDLKTTRDLGAFGRDFARLHYYGQLAWYLDGARLAGLVNDDAQAFVIAVETSEPYDVAAFVLPDDVVEAGRRLYRRLVDLWVSCRDAECWPGRYPALAELELPRWAMGADAGGEVW